MNDETSKERMNLFEGNLLLHIFVRFCLVRLLVPI